MLYVCIRNDVHNVYDLSANWNMLYLYFVTCYIADSLFCRRLFNLWCTNCSDSKSFLRDVDPRTDGRCLCIKLFRLRVSLRICEDGIAARQQMDVLIPDTLAGGRLIQQPVFFRSWMNSVRHTSLTSHSHARIPYYYRVSQYTGPTIRSHVTSQWFITLFVTSCSVPLNDLA